MRVRELLAGVVAAALLLPGIAAAQNAASVVARAIQVDSSANDAIYQMDGAGGTWEFDYEGDDIEDFFDSHFTIVKTAGPDNDGGKEQAIGVALTQNACNFWCGASPLAGGSNSNGPHTWVWTPIAPATPAAQTGWSELEGENGDPVELLITIEDLFIAEQKVLHHKPKPKGKSPWNTKISFDLLPEDIADLRIEIVIEDDESFVPVLLLDPLGEHEYNSEYADWEFNASGLQWGNPDALAKVVNDELVSDILNGAAGGDDFPGNDGETGGLRVRVEPAVPLTYLVEAPGDYTLRFSGTVRGKSLDGLADQEFQVTLSSTAVDPCDCDE